MKWVCQTCAWTHAASHSACNWCAGTNGHKSWWGGYQSSCGNEARGRGRTYEPTQQRGTRQARDIAPPFCRLAHQGSAAVSLLAEPWSVSDEVGVPDLRLDPRRQPLHVQLVRGHQRAQELVGRLP